jgi:hypothetical protein
MKISLIVEVCGEVETIPAFVFNDDFKHAVSRYDRGVAFCTINPTDDPQVFTEGDHYIGLGETSRGVAAIYEFFDKIAEMSAYEFLSTYVFAMGTDNDFIKDEDWREVTEMPLADAYMTQLHALNDGVNETQDKLSRLLSAIDKEVSNIYHTIERTELDAGFAYSAMTFLQDALLRRRTVKDEVACLNPIRTMLAANMDETIKRHRKNVAMSDEIKRELSVTLKIEDIGF